MAIDWEKAAKDATAQQGAGGIDWNAAAYEAEQANLPTPDELGVGEAPVLDPGLGRVERGKRAISEAFEPPDDQAPLGVGEPALGQEDERWKDLDNLVNLTLLGHDIDLTQAAALVYPEIVTPAFPLDMEDVDPASLQVPTVPSHKPMESLTQGYHEQSTGKFLKEGTKQVARNTLGALRLATQPLRGPGPEPPGTLIDIKDFEGAPDPIDRWAAGVIESEELKPDPTVQSRPGVQGYVDDVVMMGPQIIAQIILAMTTGVGGSMLFMGSQISGGKYLALEEQGVDPMTATKYALMDASMQAPLEAIGIGKAMKFWKAVGSKANVFKAFVQGAGTEWLTEWIQAYPDAATEIWALAEKKGKTAQEKFDLFLDGFAETTMQGMYEGLVAAPFGGVLAGGGAVNANSVMKRAFKEWEAAKKEEAALPEADIVPEVPPEAPRDRRTGVFKTPESVTEAQERLAALRKRREQVASERMMEEVGFRGRTVEERQVDHDQISDEMHEITGWLEDQGVDTSTGGVKAAAAAEPLDLGTFRIEIRDPKTGEYTTLEEGPFDSEEEAIKFGKLEVGARYRVVHEETGDVVDVDLFSLGHEIVCQEKPEPGVSGLRK